MRREIRRGFSDLSAVGGWERKILATQGRRQTYNTQHSAMAVLKDDFRRSMSNPALAYTNKR